MEIYRAEARAAGGCMECGRCGPGQIPTGDSVTDEPIFEVTVIEIGRRSTMTNRLCDDCRNKLIHLLAQMTVDQVDAAREIGRRSQSEH